MRNFIKKPYLFLLLYALTGIFTFRDFGVPVDDFTQYVIGQQNYHVIIGEQKIEDIDAGIKYYGPVFETFCYAIDSMFYGEPEPIQKWGMRHCFVFLLFTIALFYLWRMAVILFKNEIAAWFILFSVALYPRLFADAHYNSKDTVFLAFLCIGMYFLVTGISRRRTKDFIIAGLWVGMASTIRLAGFFVLPAFLLIQLWCYRNYVKKKLAVFQPLVFIIFTVMAYYVFFPALWKHPISEFQILVKHITNFPWPNNTLIAGEFVGPENMPWWYFPVWFCITVPVLYQIIFVISCILFVINWKENLKNSGLLFIISFLFSVVFYIVFTRPNLYDSWRQLQFLFVPFVLIFGISVNYFIEKLRGFKWFAGAFIVYQLIVTAWFHPFQYVYFNEYYWLYGKSNTYDQDYWHLSTSQGMKWISEHSKKNKIHVYTWNTESAWYNAFFFPKSLKQEIISVNQRELADYEIEPIRNGKPFKPDKKVVYSEYPLKDTIVRVIQLKPE
ncbi:MAG: glycosyltransferase family 39 protein [Bacteroidetes bacterium]|nr:glycosyltransferase family 39 protein [Bacteroidota bacterium]